MTLILTIQTRDSIWLVADRRLSAPGRPPIEDAIKLTSVNAKDGIALIGYAGLGATALGNQPSQWVSNVLRGRHSTLEHMLGFVADAMKREFIVHMDGIQDAGSRTHNFFVSAFLNDRPELYTIDMIHTDEGYKFRYVRHLTEGGFTPHIGLAGSGTAALYPHVRWKRPILSLINAYNRKKIHGRIVAKKLAQTAYSCHLNTSDGTVGPNCIVAWQNSQGSLRKGGGGREFFSHGEFTRSELTPINFNGINMSALAEILLEDMALHTENARVARDRGEEPPSLSEGKDEVERRVSNLPSKPDERLR